MKVGRLRSCCFMFIGSHLVFLVDFIRAGTAFSLISDDFFECWKVFDPRVNTEYELTAMSLL